LQFSSNHENPKDIENHPTEKSSIETPKDSNSEGIKTEKLFSLPSTQNLENLNIQE
jgi:hypothetical protein